MPKPTPRRIVREHRRDLRQRKHEHEIEEELERRYALLTLSVQLTHKRKLTRTDRNRRPTTLGGLSGLRQVITNVP